MPSFSSLACMFLPGHSLKVRLHFFRWFSKSLSLSICSQCLCGIKLFHWPRSTNNSSSFGKDRTFQNRKFFFFSFFFAWDETDGFYSQQNSILFWHPVARDLFANLQCGSVQPGIFARWGGLWLLSMIQQVSFLFYASPHRNRVKLCCEQADSLQAYTSPPADPGGLGARPPPSLQDFFSSKSCSFQAIWGETPYFE